MFSGTFITRRTRLGLNPSRAGVACRTAVPYCTAEPPGSHFDQKRTAGPGE
jgi:hypothetical protein